MRKLVSKDKRWAQLRNFSKYRVRGLLANVSNIRRNGVMFETEQKKLAGVERVLQEVIDSWDSFNALSKGQYIESYFKK